MTMKVYLYLSQFFSSIELTQHIKLLDFGDLPDLTTMLGLLDFLTLCNMGILFNVIDRRTYETPDQSYIDILRMDQYDYNPISEDDRRKFAYSRGISLELVHWLDSKLIVTSVEEDNVIPQEKIKIKDLQVNRITTQGLYMLQYLELRIEEEKENCGSHFPIIDLDALENQLEWAMHTIPWMETSWSDILAERPGAFYLNGPYRSSGRPLPRDETQTYVRWSEIYSFFYKHS
jgi:hypothetical protein